MKEIYAEYHPLGLEILGVSLDEDAEVWKQAIEKEALPWSQISDLKGWNSVAAKTYGLYTIPAFMLIDCEGTIILRPRFLNKQVNQKLDKLLK